MPDEPQNSPAPATDAAADNDTSNAPVELTPTQSDSRKFKADLDAEIESLWAQAEGKAPKAVESPPAEEPPSTTTTATRDERGRFVKAESPAQPVGPITEVATAEPVAETTPPAIDQAALERQVRERIEAEQRATRETEERVRAEQQHRQTYEAYIGGEGDYAAVNAALRAAQRGDSSLLDALDVVLPNGKKVSQVRPDGLGGLTASEASQLLDTWDTNRQYEDVMGTRKVQQILSYWDSQTAQALASPDVDAAKVRAYRTPGEQMQAAIDTTRAAVEARKDAEYQPQLTAKDAEIERLNQRVASLVNERGNLTSQQRAAGAATADRPGEPGALSRDLPTPEEIARMSPEDFFKSGAGDRVLRAIQGGVSTRRAV